VLRDFPRASYRMLYAPVLVDTRKAAQHARLRHEGGVGLPTQEVITRVDSYHRRGHSAKPYGVSLRPLGGGRLDDACPEPILTPGRPADTLKVPSHLHHLLGRK
jgi:hypothetical protein